MLTDLRWAQAARAAAAGALRTSSPRAVIYSDHRRPAVAARRARSASTRPRRATARDATACGSALSSAGAWRRRRCCCRSAHRPWMRRRRRPAPPGRTLIVPIPVAASGPAQAVRDIAAITYGANPSKKGLDRVDGRLEAPARRARGGRDGRARDRGRRAAGSCSTPACLSPESGECAWVGRLAPAEYRALLRRARVFVCAPRREDYGTAQLEALADGCMLVTTPSPGPYAALALARELDHRLVSEDVEASLRIGPGRPPAGLPEPRAGAAGTLQPAGRRSSRRPSSYLPRLLS